VQQQKGFDLAGKKIMIGLPAYDHKVGVKMAISLARLAQDVLEHGITIQISSICGCSVVSRARNLIAHEFLKSNCDHLLFIDSDICFEPDSVLRLLAWNQDRGVVAGAYESRKPGKIFILTLDHDKDENIIMDEMGLVKARRVATGFMMIRRDVLETLAKNHPEWEHPDNIAESKLFGFFDFALTPEGYIGEDFLFCKRVIDAGFDVWIDPTIKLSHMGIHEYHSDFGEEVIYPKLKEIAQAQRQLKLDFEDDEKELKVAYG
jgi:hypothetical protein